MADDWTFSAFMKGQDGSLHEFRAVIDPAVPAAEHQFGCRTTCTLLCTPKIIYSVSPEAARHAAWLFLARLIEYADAQMVDETGTPIALPEVAAP
jgi:hypothetical protein